MDWMLPDIAIILATIVIIFLIFIRVGRQLQVRETFFQLWVVSWLFSIIHYLGQLIGVVANKEWAGLVALVFLAYSGITFVAAAESLRGRSFAKTAPYCVSAGVLLSVWAYVDGYSLFPAVTKWLPFEGALAVLFAVAGISHYLHLRKQPTIGGAILSYTFSFWSFCFVAFAIWGDSPFFAKYSAYMYQFSNLPKPVAAIGMLIFLIECQKMNEQRQRDFAENLIENAPDGIFILDQSGRISRANKRFEEICGVPASDLLGKPISAIIQPRAVEAEGVQPGNWNEGNGSQAKTMVTANGSRTVLVTSEPILNADTAGGSMGIVKDITDRLQLEQQLLQSEKMASIGLMVSGVAHELNNPLTSVIGFTELALRETPMPSGTAERLKIVLAEARRTRAIVQKLLSAIRQQKSDRSPIQVNQIIRDTVALREHDFRLNNIEIVTELDPNIPAVMGDASDIQQVLINLMQNAFDAIREEPDAGNLEIRTTSCDGNVSIELIDDGPGLTDIGRVFDPFYTTKEVGKGTGLGLSICYQIVKGHGGDITAENLSRGAKFTIRLPACAIEEHRGKPLAADSAEATAARGRVLVVDDEPMVLTFCEEVLTSAGFIVETCSNGSDAVRSLASKYFDAVVTDHKMPGGISGADLYEWVQRNRPGDESRIIFITGDSVNRSTREFIASTGVQVVFKPFEPDELVAKVSSAACLESVSR